MDCASIFKRNLERLFENLPLFNHLHPFWWFCFLDFFLFVFSSHLCLHGASYYGQPVYNGHALALLTGWQERSVGTWWDNIEGGNVAVLLFSPDIVCCRATSVAPRRKWLSLRTHWPWTQMDRLLSEAGASAQVKSKSSFHNCTWVSPGWGWGWGAGRGVGVLEHSKEVSRSSLHLNKSRLRHGRCKCSLICRSHSYPIRRCWFLSWTCRCQLTVTDLFSSHSSLPEVNHVAVLRRGTSYLGFGPSMPQPGSPSWWSSYWRVASPTTYWAPQMAGEKALRWTIHDVLVAQAHSL